MKKISIVLVFIFILLQIVSCKNQQPTEKEILEVKLERYDSDSIVHHDDIPETTIITVDSMKKGERKDILFSQKTYELLYQDSYYYVIGDVHVDRYQILNADNPKASILLLPDNSIYAILNTPVVQLSIDKYASPEDIKSEVIQALGDCVDFSKYQYWDYVQSIPEGTENGFGLYSFKWYCKKGEWITDDFLRLAVYQNGEVSALWMKGNSKKTYDVADNLSIEPYHNLIRNKLEAIYTAKATHLQDYVINSALLTFYQGEQYMNCVIGVRYEDTSGKQWSEACELLVRVE